MELIIFLILLALGYGFGKWAESRHYSRIHRREGETARQPALTMEKVPHARPVAEVWVAQGSAVIAVDYYKKFLSSIRMFFGGEMHSYASLIDRARREALLRMKESATEADLFLNTRLETACIVGRSGKMVGSIEVLAYATAIRYEAGAQTAA